MAAFLTGLARHLPRPLQPWRWRAAMVQALLLLGVMAWAAIECFGPVHSQGIAPATHDWMLRHRLWASPADARLLILDIDERSLADMAPEFGRWPWPRDTLATVLSHAEAQGAQAVVFDILFSDPDRLRPGGDRALSLAVERSRRSFFPWLRLPKPVDASSDLKLDAVPGLAVPPVGHATRPTPSLAAVLPFFAAMQGAAAQGRLGTHTAQLDADGLLRRHAAAEDLQGWALPSMAWAVAHASHPGRERPDTLQRPIVWRDRADAYPRVPFSVAWACADGARREDCPALAGRVIVIGSTAPSLHDLRSTPLAINHAGPDILATLIDNALHGRQVSELPGWARFMLTLAALAAAVMAARAHGVAGTTRTLIGLPLGLLAIGYLSLHTEHWWIDLSLPAAAALTYLSLLRAHDALRRRMLGQSGPPAAGRWALWLRSSGAGDEQLERRLFDAAVLNPRARVSAWQDQCGQPGLPAVWVVWGLDDAGQADALLRQLSSADGHGSGTGRVSDRHNPGHLAGKFLADGSSDGGLHRELAAACAR